MFEKGRLSPPALVGPSKEETSWTLSFRLPAIGLPLNAHASPLCLRAAALNLLRGEQLANLERRSRMEGNLRDCRFELPEPLLGLISGTELAIHALANS